MNPASPLQLRPRALATLVLASLVGVVGYAWPFLAGTASQISGHSGDAPYLFMLLLALVVAVVLAELSEGGMDAKAVAMLGVLAAVGTALRALSPGTGGFEPMFFLVILAGRVFGAGFGFALGSVTIIASALATGGVGPWLPFQMQGLAWAGLFAGLLPPATGRAERVLLAAFAAVGGLGFGLLLNLTFWPFSTTLPPGLAYLADGGLAANLRHYVTFYVSTSLGWDLIRAVVNALLVLLAGRVVLATLRRAARRAAFEAPVEFVSPEVSTERTRRPSRTQQ
ncbi:ECF transporter S component [Flindersiella endophytica]